MKRGLEVKLNLALVNLPGGEDTGEGGQGAQQSAGAGASTDAWGWALCVVLCMMQTVLPQLCEMIASLNSCRKPSYKHSCLCEKWCMPLPHCSLYLTQQNTLGFV